jgi:protein involved in polysaccharide export with SLBB domain
MARRTSRLAWPVLALVLGSSGTGCADVPPPHLPQASQSTTAIGPDDVLAVDVVGEKDVSHEYQVHPDGTIDFQHGVKVGGLEPQDVGRALRQKLIDDRILADPQVSILVRQYNSRKILVTGSVGKPDSIQWTPGMTLVGAISLCGWFTPLADRGHVSIIRHTAKDKSVQVVVSVDAITRHTQEDVQLQPGDTINVTQNVF